MPWKLVFAGLLALTLIYWANHADAADLYAEAAYGLSDQADVAGWTNSGRVQLAHFALGIEHKGLYAELSHTSDPDKQDQGLSAVMVGIRMRWRL